MPCGFSLDEKICITHVSVDSAENEDLAMGRNDIIVRMTELRQLYAPQGVEMANDKTGPLGR